MPDEARYYIIYNGHEAMIFRVDVWLGQELAHECGVKGLLSAS